MRKCELCDYEGSAGMHHGPNTVCNNCMWDVVAFAVSAGMRFNRRGEHDV